MLCTVMAMDEALWEHIRKHLEFDHNARMNIIPALHEHSLAGQCGAIKTIVTGLLCSWPLHRNANECSTLPSKC